MTQEIHTRAAYTFHSPEITSNAVGKTDGLTFLRAMRDGELPPPPFADTLEFGLTEVEVGHVVFTGTPRLWQYNPIGSVHGGLISALLDSAAGCAVHTTLPAGRGYTSLDLSVKFLRPVTVETGGVSATGTVISAGRRTALAEARLTDARGRLLAHATSACLLFDLPS